MHALQGECRQYTPAQEHRHNHVQSEFKSELECGLENIFIKFKLWRLCTSNTMMYNMYHLLAMAVDGGLNFVTWTVVQIPMRMGRPHGAAMEHLRSGQRRAPS